MKHMQWFPERQAVFGQTDPILEGQLPANIAHVYTHQEQLLTLATPGSAVALATGVASGKTYGLALPYRRERLHRDDATLLCLVSTKALARQWQQRVQAMDATWKVETYTGDSKKRKSEAIDADVVIVTPEQLHYEILPNHTNWKRLLTQLHSIILDDCQEYRGIFGSHVALVIRRLQRLLLHYCPSPPLFLLGSALIANPQEHAEHLLGHPVKLIDSMHDGSVFHGCLHMLWRPSQWIDDTGLIVAKMIERGYRVIVFTPARQNVEKIVERSHHFLPPALHPQVRPYRGGYTVNEREQMENELVMEKVQCVVTNRALEVGLEMGRIDVVIITGFPGSLISYYQQAGRGGRQWQSSLCLFIPQVYNALDASFLIHPERLWNAPMESLWVNAYRIPLLERHLQCAAAELPLTEKDQQWFGSHMQPLLDELVQKGKLRQEGNYYWTRENIASKISLRSGVKDVAMRDETSKDSPQIFVPVLEWLDEHHAVSECYPGAVYYLRTIPYEVLALDQKEKNIVVTRFSGDYETHPSLSTAINILEVKRAQASEHFQWLYGKVQVTQSVAGFEKRPKRLKDAHVSEGDEETPLSSHVFDTPYSFSFNTYAAWLTCEKTWISSMTPKYVHSVLHAVEHGWIIANPLLIQGDRDEMNGITILDHPQTGCASLFLYEDCRGGNGYCEQLYPLVQALSTKTFQVLEGCSCDNGCYRCQHIPYCHSLNVGLEKKGAMRFLRHVEGALLSEI